MNKINFTHEQKKIINLKYGEHLVLAPPGTGKTEILSERIVNALNYGFKQTDLICLTFTNRSAANMITRVANKIGDNGIFIGNIHRWCSEFLYKEQIIPQSTSLLDEEDALLIIDEIKEDLGINSDYRSDFIKYNTWLKQKGLGFPDEILLPTNLLNGLLKEKNRCNLRSLYGESEDQAIQSLSKKLKKICYEYENIKKKSLYIDFDDLLTLTYNYLNKNNRIDFIPWIQVDEVQDLNPMQWAIINLISNKDSHRVFFGDYEQAIFSFLGAKTTSLKNIEENGAEIHNLSTNFRSPKNLLELFNTYAKKWLNQRWEALPISATCNPKKYQQPLQLTCVVGQPQNEARWIIENKLPKEPQAPTAILVRTNKAADMYARELDRKQLKYFKVSGTDVFKRKEVKDIFAFFKTLLNNEDRRSWARVLWLYGKVKSLRKSRYIVNNMFMIGVRPTDFVKSNPYRGCFLDHVYCFLKNNRIVVFDTETTGLDVENDDIIQIAAMEIINGRKCREFEVYINTEKDIATSEKIHHISKNDLNEKGIDKKSALTRFKNFVGKDMLVAHNIQYDRDILFFNNKRENLEQLFSEVEFVDSIDIAKRLYPRLVSYKLEYLIDEFNIDGENSHNAIDDVRATANLLLYFKDKIAVGEKTRNEFVRENNGIIKNFNQRYSPLYDAITSNFSDQLPISDVIDMVLGYMESLSGKGIDESLYVELNKITRFMKERCEINSVLKNLKKYVPEFSKFTEVDLVVGDEKIFIATIHKAKGLEFENVIIPQVVDGVFPSFYSQTEDDKIEDARLLYVAMTRAKTNLVLTYYTSLFSYIKSLSRFVNDQEIKNMFIFKTVN
jgi:DNA helicase-2/ATP-dependent DNA helicase PcrA